MATVSRSYMPHAENGHGRAMPETPIRGVLPGHLVSEEDSPLPPPPTSSIDGQYPTGEESATITAEPVPKMAPLVSSSRPSDRPDGSSSLVPSSSSRDRLARLTSSSSDAAESVLGGGRREAETSLAASFGTSRHSLTSSRTNLGSHMGLSSRSRTSLRSVSNGPAHLAEDDETPVARRTIRTSQRGSMLGQASGSGSRLASAPVEEAHQTEEETAGRKHSSRPSSRYDDEALVAARSPSPQAGALRTSTRSQRPVSFEPEELGPSAASLAHVDAEEPSSQRRLSEEPAPRSYRRASDEKVGHGGPSSSSRHVLANSMSHINGVRQPSTRDSSSPGGAEVKPRSVSAQFPYTTPGLATRTMKPGTAQATRSVRRLALGAGKPHQPARRVAAYQDNEEEERIVSEDSEARNNGGEEDGSGEQQRTGSVDRGDVEGRAAIQARLSDGRSSAAGSEERRAARQEYQRPREYSPQILGSSLLERSNQSSERRKSPPATHTETEPSLPTVTLGADEEEEGDDVDLAIPPPSRSEHHPNARRAPPASDVKENEAPRSTAGKPVDGGVGRDALGASALRTRPALAQWSGDNVKASTQQQAACQGHSEQAANEMMPPVDGSYEDAETREFYQRLQLEAIRQREAGITDAAPKPTKDLKEVSLRGFKFKKVSKAGQGGFSTVFRVRGPCSWPDGTPIPEENQAFFAMKQVTLKRLEPSSRAEVIGEADLLRNLAMHPGNEKYVLKYYCHRASSQSLKILLELGDYDLTEVFKEGPLPRERLCDFWRQMLEAVHFVHEKGGLVHTDLKPANFLMVGGRLKLIDFGIAQKIPLGTIHISRDGIVGTPNYMAPEACLAKEGKKYKAGKASDVWSLGCILYQMVYGRPPFDAIPQDRKLLTIMNPNHRIDFRPTRGLEGRSGADDPNNEVDASLQDCMRVALRHEAERRATIPDLLRHPFSMSYHVTLDRQTLSNMVCKLVKAGLTQGLSSEELQARVGIAFDNMLNDQSLVRYQARKMPPPPS